MQDNLLPEGFKDEVSNQAAIEHKYKNIIYFSKLCYHTDIMYSVNAWIIIIAEIYGTWMM